MDPAIITLIVMAIFGAGMVISVGIRQFLLSRDRKLNDEAQYKALAQEAGELEKIRVEMQDNRRFKTHYQVLGANKHAIKYVDTQIDEILSKKAALVERYAQVTIKESDIIITSRETSVERKKACDKLRDEIDRELEFYDSELVELQKKRASLWDSHIDLQKNLIDQEKSRNAKLDSIYKQHSALLEKVYIRHIDTMKDVNLKTIDAGTSSFKDALMVTLQFLLRIFTGSLSRVSPVQVKIEQDARQKVEHVEDSINDKKIEESSSSSCAISEDEDKDDVNTKSMQLV